MDLWLQFGWGMIAHCQELHNTWGDATVILSPRDLEPGQLERVVQELVAVDASVLVDPQFYLPHANHKRLTSHAYWPRNYDTAEFWAGDQLEQLVANLAQLTESCDAFIVPGITASKVDENWVDPMRRVFDTAAYAGTEGRVRYATMALASEVVNDEDQIHELLEEIEQWPVDGVYLVAEHPNGEYLVQEPNWLANMLDLVAGVRLAHKEVVIGYASHQMLLAASAGATAIAAGTWLNTRSGFDSGRYVIEDKEMAQKRPWYYCPQVLSEYKIPFLDVARRSGVLDAMAPPADFDASSCAMLFAGGQPSGSGFGEREAFRHYLKALRQQTAAATKDTFDATVAHHTALLDGADALRATLRRAGVLGQMRECGQACTDAHRGALAVLQNARGPLLRRNWVEASA